MTKKLAQLHLMCSSACKYAKDEASLGAALFDRSVFVPQGNQSDGVYLLSCVVAFDCSRSLKVARIRAMIEQEPSSQCWPN